MLFLCPVMRLDLVLERSHLFLFQSLEFKGLWKRPLSKAVACIRSIMHASQAKYQHSCSTSVSWTLHFHCSVNNSRCGVQSVGRHNNAPCIIFTWTYSASAPRWIPPAFFEAGVGRTPHRWQRRGPGDVWMNPLRSPPQGHCSVGRRTKPGRPTPPTAKETLKQTVPSVFRVGSVLCGVFQKTASGWTERGCGWGCDSFA